MQLPRVGIVDYGMGNLRSVGKAIEKLGGSVYVGSNRARLWKTQGLILPGVGAFGDAMRELKKRALSPLIRDYALSGRPLLGICLGLQLFFEKSEEDTHEDGLAIWQGEIKRFSSSKKKKIKVPHMGWNKVSLVRKHAIIKGLKSGSYFYFVHSYYAKPANQNLILGMCDYANDFPAILGKNNVTAVQFHPEKSQSDGLSILKNFMGTLP